MANKKISELTSIVSADIADGDQMEIRDINAATAEQNKKVTISELKTRVGNSVNITDNAIVRGDGGGTAIQSSGVLIDDSDNITGLAALSMGGNITGLGSAFLDEKANADADVAGDGQYWVKNDAPNTAYYTDDAGTDFNLLHRPTTWTPTLTGGSGSTTYTVQTGTYVLLDNSTVLIYAEIQTNVSSLGGAIQLSSLPFAGSASAAKRSILQVYDLTGNQFLQATAAGGTDFLIYTPSGGNPTVGNSEVWRFHGFYFRA